MLSTRNHFAGPVQYIINYCVCCFDGTAVQCSRGRQVLCQPQKVTQGLKGHGLECHWPSDRVQSTEYRVQSTEYRAQSTEYIVQSTEYRQQSTEYRAKEPEEMAAKMIVCNVPHDSEDVKGN